MDANAETGKKQKYKGRREWMSKCKDGDRPEIHGGDDSLHKILSRQSVLICIKVKLIPKRIRTGCNIPNYRSALSQPYTAAVAGADCISISWPARIIASEKRIWTRSDETRGWGPNARERFNRPEVLDRGDTREGVRRELQDQRAAHEGLRLLTTSAVYLSTSLSLKGEAQSRRARARFVVALDAKPQLRLNLIGETRIIPSPGKTFPPLL